jgi:hypothetical protein
MCRPRCKKEVGSCAESAFATAVFPAPIGPDKKITLTSVLHNREKVQVLALPHGVDGHSSQAPESPFHASL